MSLNPVYLWNPQNFPDPQAMLPDGFDAAHRIVSEWADQPLPQGADTSAFDKLAQYIAEAARSGKASADFKAAYADIETQVAEQLKSRAILELYEHYLELMPILTCRSESLGLVLYDANGATCCCPTAGNTPTKKPKTKSRHTGGSAKPKNTNGGRKTGACRRTSKTSTNTSAPKWTN